MKPSTPHGYPDDFKQALSFNGPCAIPLQRLTPTGKPSGKWLWYAMLDGAPILKNKQFGPASSFPSFEDALTFARRYETTKAKHSRNGK